MIGSHAGARKKKREPKGQRSTRRCGIRMDGWKLSGIARKRREQRCFCTSTAAVAATTAAATLPLRYCIVQSRSERSTSSILISPRE
ncbi:unnamed protein product, partial [Trichogramma brassicae]